MTKSPYLAAATGSPCSLAINTLLLSNTVRMAAQLWVAWLTRTQSTEGCTAPTELSSCAQVRSMGDASSVPVDKPNSLQAY